VLPLQQPLQALKLPKVPPALPVLL
jgi:hypothetical protein